MIERMPADERETFIAASLANPLEYFVPNGAQEKFINAVGHSLDEVKLPVILSSFGNGVGKTKASVQIIGHLVKGPQSGWFDLPLFHNWKYPKKIWYCSTAENIKDNVVPMFREIFKDGIFEEDYEEFKDGKPWVARLIIDDWEIQFKTFDQDDSTYESSTVGLVVADEPMPESKWKAVKSRRRMGCVIILPMTPLYCPPYIVDEIQRAAEEGKKGYIHIKADVYSSCKRRGIRGHRDPDILDEEVAGYDEEERQARVYGEFMYFSGRIYPTISRERNVRDEDQIPVSEHAIILMTVDPHDSRLCAVGWYAINPDGRHICIAEAPLDQSKPYWEMKRGAIRLKDEVLEWKKIEDELMEKLGRKSQTVYRIMDRHYGWQTRVTKTGVTTTLAEILSKIGALPEVKMPLYFLESYSSHTKEGEIQVGHKLIREKNHELEDGESGLIYRPHCYHHLKGATHYMRKRMTGKLADDKAAGSGKIVEKFKDFPDTDRMAVGAQMQSHIPKPKGEALDEWAEAIDAGMDIYDEEELGYVEY